MQTQTKQNNASDSKISNGDRLVVDPEKIRALVELMSEHQLTEILLKAGEDEIRLARKPVADGPLTGQVFAAPMPVAAPPSGETAPRAPVEDPSESGTRTVDASLLPVVSPMVGTFYSSPDPQAPPFVSVGSRVSNGTVVGIVEAMKVFNEITAGLSGTIVEVLVRNEEPVEYGHALFMVKPD